MKQNLKIVKATLHYSASKFENLAEMDNFLG